jgi:hypothetical protein
MKRQAVSLISMLGLLLMAGSAVAQTIYVRANIPFNFAVGNKTLPAGTYDVSTIDNRGDKTLLVQAQDRHASMMTDSNSTENLKPADKTKFVFNRYRDQYFLSEIWTAGATRGHRLAKTSREKELAKELAQDLTHQRVEIVASLY